MKFLKNTINDTRYNHLYQQALTEFDGEKDNAIFAKALVKSKGDNNKIKGFYIELRVKDLIQANNIENDAEKKAVDRIDKYLTGWIEGMKHAAACLNFPVPSHFYCSRRKLTNEQLTKLISMGEVKAFQHGKYLYIDIQPLNNKKA